MSRILLVDDEALLRSEVADFLGSQGHQVRTAGSVAEFERHLAEAPPEMAIIDVGLPDGDGFTLAADLRRRHPRLGIILLTARALTEDKLQGYQCGADHYVTKPFKLAELAAIIQALSRHLGQTADWRVDATQRRLQAPNGRTCELTDREFALLRLLASQPGQTCERRCIAEAFGIDFLAYDQRRLDTLVSRLRRKTLQETGLALPLHTAHASGYAFDGQLA